MEELKAKREYKPNINGVLDELSDLINEIECKVLGNPTKTAPPQPPMPTSSKIEEIINTIRTNINILKAVRQGLELF